MLEDMLMTDRREKECSLNQMEANMKANGMRTSSMVKVNTFSQAAKSISEIGSRVFNMEKECSLILI